MWRHWIFIWRQLSWRAAGWSREKVGWVKCRPAERKEKRSHEAFPTEPQYPCIRLNWWMNVIAIVFSRLWKSHSKVKRRASAYKRARAYSGWGYPSSNHQWFLAVKTPKPVVKWDQIQCLPSKSNHPLPNSLLGMPLLTSAESNQRDCFKVVHRGPVWVNVWDKALVLSEIPKGWQVYEVVQTVVYVTGNDEGGIENNDNFRENIIVPEMYMVQCGVWFSVV